MSLEKDITNLKESFSKINSIFEGDESYERKVKRLAKEAIEKYFPMVKISPTGDEIVDYVADAIEDESGYMDDEGYRRIAGILGVTLE